MMLSNLVLKAGELGLTLQNSDGSMPAGHNGPYEDPETPVRNTAHWLFLFATLYEKTNNPHWKEAGDKAIDYLMSPEARHFGKTFYCRDKTGKDSCNGLVGQAWVIEALVKASEVFNREDSYQLAEDVFLLHPWDKHTGLWQRVEIDGKILSFDGTFNHQLWFAAAGALLHKNDEIQNQVKAFIRKVASRVQLYPNGVIFHNSPMGSSFNYAFRGPSSFFNEVCSRLTKKKRWDKLYSKSVGYHAFNLYAFAILKQAFPNETIWHTMGFKHLITAHRSDQFKKDLENSEFGFGYHYNVSGIETAYAVETFFKDKAEAKLWLERQFKMTYIDPSRSLARGVVDVNTALVRIYEAARFAEDYDVQIG